MTSKTKHKDERDPKIQTHIHDTHIEDPVVIENNVSIIAVEHIEESSYFQIGDDFQTIADPESNNDDYTCHNETYSSSSDVQMVTVDDDSVFRMGECFDSYEALMARLEYHSEQSLVQYWRRDSRTVRAALMKTARPIQPVLKYYSVKYTCVHGGAKFSPRGKGQRNTMTLRLECPAHIMVRANKSGKELEVVSVCNHHNHQVSAHLYQRLPRTRRLPITLKEEVLDFLRMRIPRKRIKDYVFCKTGKEITNKDMLNMMGLDKRNKSIPNIERIVFLNEILRNFESDPDVIQQLEQKADTMLCNKSKKSTKVSVSRKRKRKLDQDCDMMLKVDPCEERSWIKQEEMEVHLQHEANVDDKCDNTVRYVYQEPYTSSDNAADKDIAYTDRNVIVETIETNGQTALPIHFTIQNSQNKSWLGNGVKFKRIAFDSLANILSNNEEESNNEDNDAISDQQTENDSITENGSTDMAIPSENGNDGNIKSTESELVGNINTCDNCCNIENNLNTSVNSLRSEQNTLLNEIERLRAQKEELLLEIENIKSQCVKVITVNGSDVRWIGQTEEHGECIFVEKS